MYNPAIVTNQYTQGSLVTFTVYTLNSLSQPVPPDNLIPPTYSLDYETPNGPVTITQMAIMTPISTSFYYANIDSTLLAIGSYIATITWVISGMPMTQSVRFDILAFDGATLLPIDPISRLRIRMNDMDSDPTRWVFNDQQLSEFLQDALDDLNSAPPRSCWFWFNVPLQYIQNILRGAEVLAMESMAIKLSHSPITYNDKGVTVDLKSQAATYLNIASNLREKYEQERLRIKRQYAYGFGYITTPSVPYMSTPPLRGAGRVWNL
jgi:hypothetical protein